ncbi:MAG: transposase, partial [Thermodesulfobacteriota bacterium]|nr:transposase [Thermodesulfobacteriota bacterium]
FYHVTSRGNERQSIYLDEEDNKLFLEKLSESLDVYNISLLCYVCMTNHFHFLLTTPDGNLSKFMRHFNISYTYAFNKRHKRSGHLYQGRYKSFLIDADTYLKEVSRYIHLNPVRLKKYSEMNIKEKNTLLKNYKFCSIGGYSKIIGVR